MRPWQDTQAEAAEMLYLAAGIAVGVDSAWIGLHRVALAFATVAALRSLALYRRRLREAREQGVDFRP